MNNELMSIEDIRVKDEFQIDSKDNQKKLYDLCFSHYGNL